MGEGPSEDADDESFIDVTPGRERSGEADPDADGAADRDASADPARADAGPDPADGGAAADPARADAGSDPDDDDAAAPLEDLAREVRSRRTDRSDGDASADATPGDDPFESVDVETVDDEAVWESFDEADDDAVRRVGLGAAVEETTTPDEHLVSKRQFCQRCPHFAAPPETACTRPETTIVEVVEDDRFRVRNCPVAADRSAGDRRGE